MSTDIKSITDAKAKVLVELQKLEEQENRLQADKAAEAVKDIADLLGQYGRFLTPAQRNELATLIGASTPATAPVAKASRARREVAPKYWLPHTQETWTGRGRTPKAFAAWEGSQAHQEWKKHHPGEKFPRFPG